MKYTIEGFDQKTAIEYGLDVTDLAILRWFVDFMSTRKIVKMQCEGREFCWVNYKGLLEDMPILNIKKDTLARRMNKFVEAGVLEHRTLKTGGTFSLYRIGENYQNLIERRTDVGKMVPDLLQKGTEKKSDGTDLKSDPYGNISAPPTEKKSEQNIILQNKTILQNKEKENKKEKQSFSPADTLNDSELTDGMKMKLTEWLSYKREIKDMYKSEIGFKRLLTQVSKFSSQYGEPAVTALIDESMSNGWKGIIWDRIQRQGYQQSNSDNQYYKQQIDKMVNQECPDIPTPEEGGYL